MFWDLREKFISGLYRGSVEGARLDSVLPHFDAVRHSNQDLKRFLPPDFSFPLMTL